MKKATKRQIEVRGLGTVTLEKGPGNQGGYGAVFRGIFTDGEQEVAVAVKFLRTDAPGPEYTEEMRQKDRDRFSHEIDLLKKFKKKHWDSWKGERLAPMPLFPLFYGNGECNGTPFYVMEWLSPVNLLTLDTNDKRHAYVMDVCGAVDELHGAGYVHYDIKPSNIMMRSRDDGQVEYVLVDFGSVHEVEASDGSRRGGVSVSQLSDGRRTYPHTPGYADPLETLHTVNADIYAIGQVIRDTFPESVAPEWAGIIDKCTSRNRDYRYRNVADIIEDLEMLKSRHYAQGAAEDLHIWSVQKSVSEENAEEMTWDDLRMKMAFQPLQIEDESYPTAPAAFSPASELLIDFGRIGCRNIRITDPIHMSPNGLLVVRGNGKISIDLDGTGESHDDYFNEEAARWDEPVYPFVILLDGANLENRTKLDNEEAGLMYMVGKYCLLNFPERDASERPEDPRYILTGRAGYSFVRNGRQGLYEILSEGRRGLFAQQKWDELDLRGLLRVLGRIRCRTDDVQEWLERNVESVLMRNLGRYDILAQDSAPEK